VIDTSGATVPRAEIKVVNQATNISRTVSSDAFGNYEATHLNPGLYTVIAEAPGFKRVVHREIRLEALASVRIDIRLEVGEVAAEVTVVGGAPVIETETSTLSQVRPSRQLLDLPLNLIGSTAPLYQFTILTPTAAEGGGRCVLSPAGAAPKPSSTSMASAPTPSFTAIRKPPCSPRWNPCRKSRSSLSTTGRSLPTPAT